MAQTKIHEKREYHRVDLSSRVMVKPVSREEFERNKGAGPDTSAVSLPLTESGVPEGRLNDIPRGALAERLTQIEAKLDRILRKLDPEVDSCESTACGSARNISGAGINLTLEDPLEVGQLVLISLSVPGFSIGFLHAYGEVVHVVPCKAKGRSSFDTGIKFMYISDKERDVLVSYTFQKQREEIRGRITAKERDRELV
jgi:hypothetical protein